ncbi:hypothetical protein [Arcanobacterium phocae]|uniref:hypothetical protein n=1 Tax=Arcanobacterium phocae TaxID=131112 RepID=UPI001C0E9CA0|nr:hypothetical protein [Arcanobacterium phocae]
MSQNMYRRGRFVQRRSPATVEYVNTKRGPGSRPPRKGGRPTPSSATNRTPMERSERRRNQEQRPRTVQARPRRVENKRVNPTVQRRRAARAQAGREALLRRRRTRKRIAGVVGAIVAIAATIWLVSFSLQKIQEQTAPPDPARAFDPVPCSVEDLSATLSHQGSVSGRPVNIGIKVKNSRSKAPCVMETSPKDFKVTIETGDLKVFDSATCDVGVSAPRLLLSKDVESNQKITWNGMYSGKLCSTTTPANPGTYIARAYYLGEELTAKGYAFELVAPAPPPEAKPAE